MLSLIFQQVKTQAGNGYNCFHTRRVLLFISKHSFLSLHYKMFTHPGAAFRSGWRESNEKIRYPPVLEALISKTCQLFSSSSNPPAGFPLVNLLVFSNGLLGSSLRKPRQCIPGKMLVKLIDCL